MKTSPLTRIWVVLAALFLMGGGSLALRAEDDPPPNNGKQTKPMDEPPPTSKDTQSSNAGEPTCLVDMRDERWSKGLECVCDTTGLPVIPVVSSPTGSFNFINPKGKKYTIPEIIDIINDGLAIQK